MTGQANPSESPAATAGQRLVAALTPQQVQTLLGPQATTCVLRWTWLGLAYEPSPGPQLADTIHSLENKLKQVGLDTDACVAFFSQLPDAVARDILAHLRSEDYADAVADLRSIWHRIRHADSNNPRPSTLTCLGRR